MKTQVSIVVCALMALAITGCHHKTANYTVTSESAVTYQQAAPHQSSGGAPAANDGNFDSEITGMKGVAIVDFNAKWCGPCRKMTPVIDALAGEVGADTKIMKLDVDTNQVTADKFDVHSIPCLIIFKDGAEVDRHYGIHSKDELKTWIQNYSDKSVSLAR